MAEYLCLILWKSDYVTEQIEVVVLKNLLVNQLKKYVSKDVTFSKCFIEDSLCILDLDATVSPLSHSNFNLTLKLSKQPKRINRLLSH